MLPTAATALALLPAFLLSPLLMSRLLAPHASALSRAALAGVLSIALNTMLPLALHLGSYAIDATNLALVHWSLCLALYVLAHCRPRLLCDVTDLRMPLLLFAGFAGLVLPFTHLAGMDTYRWQDLATNVIVERRIPWLVHPLSLLGFTPRAYPCAQPLILATAQALGHLGVVHEQPT